MKSTSHMNIPKTTNTGPRQLPLVAFFVVIATLAMAWTGYYGSDDQAYASGGLGWLNHFPYVGESHWTLRHTIVIPMAFFFRLFGISEFTLVLPVLGYLFALLALIYVMMSRHFDRATAAIAVVVLGTLPLMSLGATTVVPDFAEVFFCLSSLSLFFEATRSQRRNLLLVLAGVAAGFSWLTRETVVFFLLTYGLLFAAGYGVSRKYYFLMAAGFLGIVAVELVYFWAMTGNPLHRVTTDVLTHLGGDTIGGNKALSSGIEHAVSKVEGKLVGPLARTGNLSVNRFLDPILAVLANQEFMFLYYLAVPVAAWVAIRRIFTGTQAAFLGLVGLAGLIWFVCLYFQIGMTLLPRYYMLPSVALILVFAAWLRTVLWRRSPALSVVLLLGLIATHLVGIYVDNKNPIFGERALVEFLRQTNAVVLTDPETARNGGFLYEIAGVESRVVAGPPEPGKLFFYNPKYVTFGAMAIDREERLKRLACYQPQPEWVMVWHKDPEPRWIGQVIDGLGVSDLLPKEIYRRLVQPNFPVTVYRP
jgi:hypothetical protein